MDVSSPITSVVPSLDGPVLHALAGTSAPLTLSQLHRLAGRGSVSGVRKVVIRLWEEGLVHDEPGGYVLNREHVAAPAVELLAGLHGELLRRIGEVIDEWGGSVALAGLFGSAARRDGDAASDVDVLVVADGVDLDELGEELGRRIKGWTGNRAHVVAIPTSEMRRLRRAKERIVAEWERDLVLIRGDRSALKGAG